MCVCEYLLPVESIVQLHKQQAARRCLCCCLALVLFSLLFFRCWDLRSTIFAVHLLPAFTCILSLRCALYLPLDKLAVSERACVCVCVCAHTRSLCSCNGATSKSASVSNSTWRCADANCESREWSEEKQKRRKTEKQHRIEIVTRHSISLQIVSPSTPTLRCRRALPPLSHRIYRSFSRSLDLPLI